jgi:hypothetical protein
MQSNRGRRSLGIAWLALLLTLVIPAANADPIGIPGYTVTDLGAGTPTFGTDAAGNGILNAPNGQTFAFPQTPNEILTPGQGTLANLPQLQPAPYGWDDYGNPNNSFSYVTSALMNASGMVLATNVAGIYGHEYSTSLFEIQHNADGTWGQPQGVYTGGTQFELQSIASGVHGMLSNSNEVLIQDATNPNGSTNLFLYNANTQNLTNISSLLLSAGYLQFQPIAIDDLGRIVLSAQMDNPSAGYPETNLLLTPDGLSAAPLEAPVPEPGALMVLLTAGLGFAIKLVRERLRAG